MSTNQERPISPYVVGPPVEGDNFFGRRNQAETLFRTLSGPQLVPMRLLGIRRSGKTSFLKYVSRPEIYNKRIESQGLPILLAYVDLQADIREPMDFFQEVADAIVKAAPGDDRLPSPERFERFRGFVMWLKEVFLRYRIVVLLDEFEVLGTSESFDLSFFRALRSLVDCRMVWVTASSRDVVDVSTCPGSVDPASPLYNVFYSDPIYLGALEESEARDLVRQPALRKDVRFSDDEVTAIRRIAGDMPFLLQATADQWFQAAVERVPQAERLDKTMARLLQQNSQIQLQLRSYWRHFRFKEQRCLKRLAGRGQTTGESKGQDIRTRLESLGLVTRQEGDPRIASSVFERWIEEFSDAAPGIAHVFIGHGHSRLWLEVERYIEKELELKAVDFESESRASKSIEAILTGMREKTEFAIIVVTAEDKTAEGKMRPRQNVVHEAGFFQGALGFPRVVLLVQEEVEMFSNLDGLQCIRFEGSDIESTFRELVAILKRENIPI